MDPLIVAAFLLVGAILHAFYRRLYKISLRDVPGPEAESYLLEQFGGIVHIKGLFGDDRLWISDPKALQHIYHTSGYNYPKQPGRRVTSRLFSDEGLVWADGEMHKRQRRAMMPAFGQPEAKALVPIFNRNAAKITQKWKDLLSDTNQDNIVVNIVIPLSNATLDAIGEAAFDYKFGCMENGNNELSRVYNNVVAHGGPPPSSGRIVFLELTHYIPMWLSNFIYDHFPSDVLQATRDNRDVAHKVARELIATHSNSGAEKSRDVMSILIRANRSSDDKNRLTDEELTAQMRTILLAGHETTANTLTWGLMDIATNKDVQARLRSEIYSRRAIIQARGDGEFSVSDFEAMPYLIAVVKEILRLRPVVFFNHRQAAKDDVLPLSKPLTLKSGRVVSEIAVPKGTKLLLSIEGYNRNKDLWGEDADIFNPDRWLRGDPAQRTSYVGTYSNLLTFAGGVRSCIGWRFALYEIQAFLVELITNFEFARTPELDRLQKVPCVVRTPAIDGDLKKGAQMPLRVSLAPGDQL